MDDHFAEPGAFRGQVIPDPNGQVFKRRIFQALDLVKNPVIELLDDLFCGLANLRVVVKPPHFGIDLPFHGYFRAETVPVHPPALVARRNVGQRVGRLKTEILGQSNFHG